MYRIPSLQPATVLDSRYHVTPLHQTLPRADGAAKNTPSYRSDHGETRHTEQDREDQF